MNKNFILNQQHVQFHLSLKDPFIFAAHHLDHYPAGNEHMAPVKIDRPVQWGNDFNPDVPYRMYHGENVPGFPAHPHSGFETITIVEQGFADHFDSKGSSGRYGQGDVQWLTTGKGVQHSEMFPLLSTEHENVLELFQIWFNLANEDKQAEPAYKMLWNEAIPVVKGQDQDGHSYQVKVIAGQFAQTQSLEATPNSWASRKGSQVNIWLISLAPHARLEIPASDENITRFFYLFKGLNVFVNDVQINDHDLLDLDSSVALTVVNGSKASQILWLEGKPIHEEIVQHGPFVASNRQELFKAFEAYQKDEFGGWEWGANDPVLKRDQGRIASYDFGQRTEYPPAPRAVTDIPVN